MEIRRIEYKNIYGTLSGKLNFFRGENFLVGINGCGKTTVLNLIRWVLKPSFPDLCTLQHDLIKIDIKHGKYMYSIQSRILKDEHELKVVSKDKSRNFESIMTTLHINPQKIREYREDIQDLYERLSPESHEVSTWTFLTQELPNPVFIGLERSVDDDQSKKSVQRRRVYAKRGEGFSALGTAKNLMRDAFNTGKQQLVEINDELNRRVLELSFSGVLRPKFRNRSGSLKETAKKIKQLKDRFESASNENTAFKAFSDEKVSAAIIKYLNELASLLSGDRKEDELWVMLNQHNFDRTAKMFDLFKDYESKAKKVQMEIDNFSNAVNKFIRDSGKSIGFNDNTGVPYFETLSSSEKLKLSELSSGETQVVVILSYFAFLAKRGIPIVIDEPELSLHVQWQKYFVDAVKEVMPEECQTIMATHSPEICGAENVNVQSISVRTTK